MLRRRAAPGVETRLRKRLRPASRSPEASPAPDDLAVDPRLMTERQQLAFLLRATAHDASSSSGADGDEDADEDSSKVSGEDEGRPRALRRLRRAADTPAVIYRGRGRPPKNAAVPGRRGDDKENARDEPDADEPWHADGSLPSAAAPSVTCADKPERPEAKISAAAPAPEAKIPADPACALCGGGERLVVDATAPLFLCARCDRKYPTQQALGRPCAA